MKQTGSILLLPLLIISLLIVITAGVYLKFAAPIFFAKTVEPILSFLTPTPSPYPNLESPNSNSDKLWILKRSNQGKEEIIYQISEYSIPLISRHENFLYFGKGDYSSYPQITKYNLTNGERTIIFEDREATRTKRKAQYISDLQIIDNTLFFSTGGYLQQGGFYAIDLPNGKPKLLTEGANGTLQKIRDSYYLRNGEGDACWGTSIYRYFDHKSKTLGPKLDFTYSCGDGDIFLGVDTQNRFLSAHSEKDPNNFENTQEGFYTKLESTNNKLPSDKRTILGKSQIPSNVTAVRYSSDQNQVLLLSLQVVTQLYLFDIGTNKLEKVIELPSASRGGYISDWIGQTVCFDNNNQNYIEIRLDTQQTLPTSDICKNVPGSYHQKELDKTRQLIKELDLPKEYTFTLQ